MPVGHILPAGGSQSPHQPTPYKEFSCRAASARYSPAHCHSLASCSGTSQPGLPAGSCLQLMKHLQLQAGPVRHSPPLGWSNLHNCCPTPCLPAPPPPSRALNKRHQAGPVRHFPSLGRPIEDGGSYCCRAGTTQARAHTPTLPTQHCCCRAVLTHHTHTHTPRATPGQAAAGPFTHAPAAQYTDLLWKPNRSGLLKSIGPLLMHTQICSGNQTDPVY